MDHPPPCKGDLSPDSQDPWPDFGETPPKPILNLLLKLTPILTGNGGEIGESDIRSKQVDPRPRSYHWDPPRGGGVPTATGIGKPHIHFIKFSKKFEKGTKQFCTWILLYQFFTEEGEIFRRGQVGGRRGAKRARTDLEANSDNAGPWDAHPPGSLGPGSDCLRQGS